MIAAKEYPQKPVQARGRQQAAMKCPDDSFMTACPTSRKTGTTLQGTIPCAVFS